MHDCMALLVSFMFEKVTKYFTNRVADNAVDGVKTSLNEKFDQYGDIIRIGLVLTVIILGGRHITKRSRDDNYPPPDSLSVARPGPPVIINNYYQGVQPPSVNDNRRRPQNEQQNRQIRIPGKTEKAYRKR